MPSAPNETARPEQEDQQTRRLPAWLCLVLGAMLALAGLLPWLVTGGRLPLQNLWDTETMPEAMPRVLLPFSQYAIVSIIAVLVTGAAAAGLVVRALGPRRRYGALATVGGVAVVQLVALVQTARVVHAGLIGGRASTLYLALLVAVSVLSILVGVLALILVAAAPRAGAVVGLSVGALALGPWLTGLVAPFGTVTFTPTILQFLGILRWVPPVLVGAAIAWAGLRTVGRIVAALTGLVLLWIVPALITAISNAAGSRVLARQPDEMARYAVEVFRSALTTPALVLPPVLVAVAIAAVGLLGHTFWKRRRRADV